VSTLWNLTANIVSDDQATLYQGFVEATGKTMTTIRDSSGGPTEHVLQPKSAFKRRLADDNTSRQNEQIARHSGRLTIRQTSFFGLATHRLGLYRKAGLLWDVLQHSHGLARRSAARGCGCRGLTATVGFLPSLTERELASDSTTNPNWPFTICKPINPRSLKRLLAFQGCIASSRARADLSACMRWRDGKMGKTSRRGMTAGRQGVGRPALLAGRLLQLSRRDPASSLHRFR
jgi:hypothetical protein